MIKIIFILLWINFSAQANNIKLFLEHKEVKNGTTALLFLEASSPLAHPKLTFDKLNIDFRTYPSQANKYFAFVPVDYYTNLGAHTIIISYKDNGKKQFKAVTLTVIDADYKSEVIKVQQSKVELKQQDKQRTKKEYEEAMQLYRYVSPSNFTSSGFENPLNTDITSQFGTKRVYNDTIKSYHSGTDFKAATGTNIYASAEGIVKMAQNRFYAGNSIVLDHGYGVYSGYYHLSKLLVHKNQRVKKGELLGLSGVTGRVTGPHLHFSFRVHGIQVDPLQFIQVANRIK